jgi:hypothetical protein
MCSHSAHCEIISGEPVCSLRKQRPAYTQMLTNPCTHAQIMAGGVYVGSLERDGDLAVVLNDAADKVGRANDGKDVTLDILVMQIGRSNFGNLYDLKGLVSSTVLLNSARPPERSHSGGFIEGSRP